MKAISGKGSFQLDEKDQKLIEELVLSPTMTVLEVDSRVAVLNMRQLDRLKLMFLRIQSEENVFSEFALSGIMSNQLSSFTEALFTLWKASGSKQSSRTKDKA